MQKIDFASFSSDDLQSLITAASQVLRERQAAPRRVTVAFNGYNPRRYSRPWIALVTAWPVGRSPELAFGNYIGSAVGGEAEVLARPGALVKWGQKDLRGNHTTSCWGSVEDDGSIRQVSQQEARQLFSGAQ